MPAPSDVRVWRSWIAALLLCVAGAGSVRAQEEFDQSPTSTLSDEPNAVQLSTEEADKRARVLFEQGRVAFQEGRYRDAWDYFRRAYLLSKRPELLYNVGQSADRMRMDREALEAFRLYLKRLPDAANRREVENRIRALQERQRGGVEATEPPAASASTQTEAQGETKGEPPPLGGIFNTNEPPIPPPPSDGQPKRTGMYVRFSAGLGLLVDGVSSSGFSSTLSSGTFVASAGLGYDVDQGIVIGGGLFFDWSLSPSLHTGSAHTDLDSANFTTLAAFVDYYLAPRQDGWHLLGGLGVSWMSLSDPSGMIGNRTAGGLALMAGGGYEWPLDDEWAIGVLGRLMLARMSQDPRNHTLFAPSIAFTAAWY
jgi:tetratricopeptide (TPR) repeat protein